MHKRIASAGFTLVEVAIVLTITGVLLSGGILALTGMLNDARYNTTKKQLDRIADAVAVYTQRNYFVPCPAPPPTAGVTPDGVARQVCAGGNDRFGIVPYATLGLTLEQIRDGYGNYITYAVSPVGTQSVLNNTDPDIQCRTRKIWVTTPDNVTGLTGTGDALNENKARFCCPTITGANKNAGSDMRILNDTGVAIMLPRTANTAGAVTTFGPPPVPVPPNTNPRTQTPVVVLVSHGRNGFGAFLPGGGRLNGVPPASLEAMNTDFDNDFRLADFSNNRANNSANFFDDIIIWRTQEQLMSSFGRDSCTRP